MILTPSASPPLPPFGSSSMPPKARETKVTTSGERLWCRKGGTKTFKIGNQISTNAMGSHIAFRAQELEISDPKVLLLE